MLPYLLHGQETKVWGDSDHTGYTKVIEEHAPWAADLTRAGAATSTSARCSDINRKRPRVRARAEHTKARRLGR